MKLMMRRQGSSEWEEIKGYSDLSLLDEFMPKEKTLDWHFYIPPEEFKKIIGRYLFPKD